MYIFLIIIIFGINVIPAFMPPTWIILAFFYTHYHLAFFPTVILGVIAATAGRTVLALLARHSKPFLSHQFIQNYESLGTVLQAKKKVTIPLILGYAFSPLSSNNLFIIAGLSNLNLAIVSGSFFLGRLISYTFWVTFSYHMPQRLEDIFSRDLTNIGAFISAAISIVVIYVLGKINWTKLLQQSKAF